MTEVFFVLIASTVYDFSQITCIINQHKAGIDIPALTALADFCCGIASLKFEVLHSTRECYRLTKGSENS